MTFICKALIEDLLMAQNPGFSLEYLQSGVPDFDRLRVDVPGLVVIGLLCGLSLLLTVLWLLAVRKYVLRAKLRSLDRKAVTYSAKAQELTATE